MKTFDLVLSRLTPILTSTFIFMLASDLGCSRSTASKEVVPAGIWLGTLKVPGQELRTGMTIEQQPNGSLVGTFSSIDQGAMNLPVDELVFSNRNLHLSLNSFHASYDGILEADGKHITGKWRQGGGELSLAFQKVQQLPCLNRPQNPIKPYPYQEEEVRYKNKKAGIDLAGTLTLPKGSGPFPAVILLTGSGPQNRDEELFQHKPFLVLSDYLTRRGIAVLRSDDRGVGGSSGDFSRATTGDFADDALAGVAYLKTRRDIKAKCIGLVGHSEGGMMAPIAAAHSDDVAFIVMLAGTGVPFSEIVVGQISRSMHSGGAPDEVVAAVRAWHLKLYEVAGKPIDNATAEREIRSLYSSLDERQKRIIDWSPEKLEQEIPGLLAPWWRYAMGYSPRATLKNVVCPVLALNGGKDTQVLPEPNLRAIEEALRQGQNKNCTVKELAGLNHMFQTAQTGEESEYVRIEETMAPVAMQVTADWVLQLPNAK